jgi:hypothetical protein
VDPGVRFCAGKDISKFSSSCWHWWCSLLLGFVSGFSSQYHWHSY